MERIVAVNTNCYHGYSLNEALSGIAEAGFKYIELTATKGWTEHVMPEMSFKELYNIKLKIQEMGLSVIGFSGHCNLLDEDRLHDFVDNIRLAGFFESKYIVTSIGEAHFGSNKSSSLKLLTENIKSLIPELKANNLKLVLEIHGAYSTASIMEKIVDAVSSEIVGINYDTANAIFYGNVDPTQDIKKCIDKILYMHIKDKAGANNEWNFPALGKGYIDFPSILSQLDAYKNYCPLSIEIEFTQKGAKDINEVNDAVRYSGDYLKSLGYQI
jgi:sugar phosphate isomerase/epimerase